MIKKLNFIDIKQHIVLYYELTAVLILFLWVVYQSETAKDEEAVFYEMGRRKFIIANRSF
jgi:hypothetical protein